MKKTKLTIIFIIYFLIMQMIVFPFPVKADNLTTSFTEYNGQNCKMYHRYASNWENACSATSAYANPDFNYIYTYNSPNTNILQRGFMVFDTSSIPDNAIITGVSLSFTISTAYTSGYTYIQDSNSGNSIEKADFNRANFGDLYVNWSWDGSTGLKNVSFTSNVASSIEIDGYTQLVIRHQNDYLAQTPTGDNGFIVDDEANVKLWVTYQTNNPPTISLKSPLNNSQNQTIKPRCWIWANDSDAGDTLTITWQTNISGSWVTKQVNSSVPSNSDIRWDFIDAENQWTKYYFKVYVNDTTINISYIYNFKTMLYYMNTSYNDIIPINDSAHNFYIQANLIKPALMNWLNHTFNKSTKQGYNTETKVYFNKTLLQTTSGINYSISVNILENYTKRIRTDTWYTWSINTTYYNISVNRTYNVKYNTVILNYTYDNTSLTIINNTANVTGYYEQHYNSTTGWMVYLNYTGNASASPSICQTILRPNEDWYHTNIGLSAGTTVYELIDDTIADDAGTYIYHNALPGEASLFYVNFTAPPISAGKIYNLTFSIRARNTSGGHIGAEYDIDGDLSNLTADWFLWHQIQLTDTWTTYNYTYEQVEIGGSNVDWEWEYLEGLCFYPYLSKDVEITQIYVTITHECIQSYNLTILLQSLEGTNFTINWNGDYTGTGNNITIPIYKDTNITGTIEVLGMEIQLEINQLNIIVLIGLMMFFIIAGYASKNMKTSACLLIFAGLFTILAMLSTIAYFGGIWYLSSPVFILISMIFFKDAYLNLTS